DGGADDNFHAQPGSPTIDAGDPNDPVGSEPTPHGGRINQGSDGGTAQATQSPPALVQVLAPNGLEKLQQGQAFTITWRSAGVDPSATVSIVLLQAGNPTPVATIASGISNSGSYTWSLPTDLPVAHDYQLEVTVDGGGAVSGLSSEPFLVTNNG